VRQRLSEGKQIRRTLIGGRVHIDRPLPFVCLYRQPAKADQGTKRLVFGEASYITASGSPEFGVQLKDLVLTVVEELSSKFGAFLIVEIWAGEENSANGDMPGPTGRPAFRIFTDNHKYGPLVTVLSRFVNALGKMMVLNKPAQAEIMFKTKAAPPAFAPILKSSELKKFNCKLIGLEVLPVYRSQNPDKFFPLELQALHRGVSKALKKAVFEFAQSQTLKRPAHYQTLGRRAMVKAVWKVDRCLAEVGEAFDLLLLITPVNVDTAWSHFKRTRFRESPVFYYRPLPVDPSALKQKLFSAPLQSIEDPTLEQLFRDKQVELDQKLTMLTNRGSRRMLHGCLQLYGDVEDTLVLQAKKLLRSLPKNSRNKGKQRMLGSKAFAGRALEEMDYYRKQHSRFTGTVQVRDDVYGNIAVRGDLWVGKNVRIPEDRVEALIQHEVGTHLVTYFNAKVQPFRQLVSGMAGYEELQEGLAVLAEHLVGGLTPSRLRIIAARVIAVKSLTDRKSFKETFTLLVDEYGIGDSMAFLITMRSYRGGGLTKDIIYLRGFLNLMRYLKNGGDLEPLFVGKMAVRHIPVIEELLRRKVLSPAMIRPRYIDLPETKIRLERLRKGVSLNELTTNGGGA
jgi:uncharacterized protein (TIGR02421 family)